MWQANIPMFATFWFGETSMDYSIGGLLGPVFPWPPRRSITDRLELPAFPLPYVRYAPIQPTRVRDGIAELTGFAMAVEGGIKSFSYGTDGLTLYSDLALIIKWPIAPAMWLDASLRANLENVTPSSGVPAIGVGMQVTRTFAFIASYRPIVDFWPETELTHTGQAQLILNPTRHFGIRLEGHVVYHERYWTLSPWLWLVFQW
jgi:hypothetical protein